MKIGELFPNATGMLAAISDLTLEDLKGDITNRIFVKDILGVNDDTTNRFLLAMCYKKTDNEFGEKVIDRTQPRTIADFKNPDALFGELLIDDFVDCDGDDKLLLAIKGTAISELSTKLSNLVVKDVIDFDNIPAGLTKNVLSYLEECKIHDIGETMGSVPLLVALQDEVYDENGQVKNIWKLLLCEDISASQEIRTDYTLNDFSLLIDNMNNNIQNANLYTLVDLGVISVDGNLDRHVIPGDNTSPTFGSLTISQFISLFLQA